MKVKGALVVQKLISETGVLREANCIAFKREVHEIHPDSKKPIKGVKIPNWKRDKKKRC